MLLRTTDLECSLYLIAGNMPLAHLADPGNMGSTRRWEGVSSGLGDTCDVEGKPGVSIGHCRSPVPSTVLALSRCSYKSVGEQRRVGGLAREPCVRAGPFVSRSKEASS